MRILLWIGNEPNQKALANKIAAEFNVVGIVTESRISRRKLTLRKVLNSVYERTFLSEINKAWWNLHKFYSSNYPDYPSTNRLDVENINSTEAHAFSKKLSPDLIIVSGTRIVKSNMLSIQTAKGILNLHTGLSPYIKGGPNCTNWCIATNQFHLVGNTIMWIDEGIDSGNILTSEKTDVDWNKSLTDIHIEVMEHAHSLYLKAIRLLNEGGNSNVKQDQIANGKTYYTKDWKLKNKIDLVRNLKAYRKRKQKDLKKDKIQTIRI